MAIDYAEYEEAAVSFPDDEVLGAPQAAAYLAKKWGRPFTTKDFNNLRVNARIKAKKSGKPVSEFFPIEPVYSDPRTTAWRQADLDILAESIEPPQIRKEVRGEGKRRSKG